MFLEKALLGVAARLEHMDRSTVFGKDIQCQLPQALRPRHVNHEEGQVSADPPSLVVIVDHDAELRPVLRGGRGIMVQGGTADDPLTVPILK